MENTTKKKSAFARHSLGDKVFLLVGYVILGLFVLAIIVPMVYIIIASFMDPITLQNTGITFDFEKWTLTAYERVISNGQIWVGFKNAIVYSLLFTFLSVAITMLCAYPMSLTDFRGRKFFNVLFMITMFFGGGLIPTYLLISNL
ncbi:MAG: carbohydrate ABC transporter permease, partial [Lachnospiraceae bacterium]|nr:carbohydrate ABC transporter permease [Lachnospiraceae bacterium]